MTSLYPFWCNNGGPLNWEIAVQINSLLNICLGVSVNTPVVGGTVLR